MISIRRSADRGHARLGWLDSYHTFSFGTYHDPEHMGFSVLRVINQDRVLPGQGFQTHGHQDMEIVSYVLDGILEHKDSMGNGSQMRPGDVQLMSAGTGVTHSEFNASNEEGLHFLQMWILPARQGTEPRYEQRMFPEESRRGHLRLVVSPDGADGSVTIGQDVRLWAGLFDGDEAATLDLPDDRCAWVHVARGSVSLNGETLEPGDGAAVQGEPALTLNEGRQAELVVWDLPAQ
jgi:redox-sensitive bicupin YhaK (pirin superfamily)